MAGEVVVLRGLSIVMQGVVANPTVNIKIKRAAGRPGCLHQQPVIFYTGCICYCARGRTGKLL